MVKLIKILDFLMLILVLFNKARNYMDENPDKSDEEVDIYLKDFLWNLTQEITELDISRDDAIRSIMLISL